MKSRIYLYLILALFPLALLAGISSFQYNPRPEITSSNITDEFPDETYPADWKSVDSLASAGLSRQAEEKCREIYGKAQNAGNTPQVLKALIRMMMFRQNYTEESWKVFYDDLSAEIPRSRGVLQALLYSIRAEILTSYSRQFRWQILKRTKVSEPGADILTWDYSALQTQIRNDLLLSLSSSALTSNVPIQKIEPILSGNQSDRAFRPTVFDFLAYRAIQYFMNDQNLLDIPVYAFEISDPSWFGDPKTFCTLQPSTIDTFNFKLLILKIFREQIKLHAAEGRKEALFEADLSRLKFVYANCILPEKDSLYLDALNNLSKRSEGLLAAEAQYEIAKTLSAMDAGFQPLYNRKGDPGLSRKAVEICKNILQAWPNSMVAYNAGILMDNIKKPTVQIKMNSVLVPNKKNLLLLTYKNTSKAHFRIVKTDMGKWEEVQNSYDYGSIRSFLRKQIVQTSWEQPLTNDGLFHEHKSEIFIPAIPVGHYVLIASTKELNNDTTGEWFYAGFQVSELGWLTRNQAGGSLDVKIFNRISGEPESGAAVKIYEQKYDYLTRTYTYRQTALKVTDAFGNCTYAQPDNQYHSIRMEISKGEDRVQNREGLYAYSYQQNKKMSTSVRFFTDRLIYRPGQTLFFKAICLEGYEGNWKIAPGYNTDVTLHDANGQKVKTSSFKSNEFGTFNGSFVLPESGMTGQMSLVSPYGMIYFSVEEYKRPKFEVKTDTLKGSYICGDSVSISGQAKALSGFGISSSKVRYRIRRTASKPLYYDFFSRLYTDNRYGSSTEIASGYTQTDDSGKFVIRFKASPDKSIDRQEDPVFTYLITADVTDGTGETRSVSKSVRIGYRALELGIESKNILQSGSKDAVTITSNNLNGDPEPSDIHVKITKLKPYPEALHSRMWEQPDVMTIPLRDFKSNFPDKLYFNENDPNSFETERTVIQLTLRSASKSVVTINSIPGLHAGIYRIDTETNDRLGNTIKAHRFVTVYDPVSAETVSQDFFWTDCRTTTLEPGDTALFTIGAAKGGIVFYEIFREDKALISERILLKKGEQKTLKHRIEEADRGNISVHFTMIKGEETFADSYTLRVPYTNRELRLKWNTFRSNLLPGSEETWSLNVNAILGEKEAAEVLAAMYDASLDAFRPNVWNLNTDLTHTNRNAWGESLRTLAKTGFLYNYYYSPKSAHIRTYEYLNWFGMYLNGLNEYYTLSWKLRGISGGYYDGDTEADVLREVQTVSGVATGRTKATGVYRNALAKAEETTAIKNIEQNSRMDDVGDETLNNKDSRNEMSGERTSQTKARSNFAETAFFMPELRTDEKGNVLLQFKMPESITRWKFMALAHTKSLRYGTLSDEVVTKKELMVNSFAPRFLREDDKIFYSVKVTNLTDKEILADITLDVQEVLTNRKIPLNEPAKKIQIAAGASAKIEWELNIIPGMQVLKFTASASSENHRDAEEITIPVLSNRILVTESFPLPVRGNQIKSFQWKKFIDQKQSGSLRTEKLTLEFTQNPAWYAIQSLPYMMEFPYECAEQTFSRLYANSIGAHIANSDPKIKSVFDVWRAYPENTLKSALEKNQDLKNILLEESPWVREAQNETERKRRVGVLFDLDRMNREYSKAKKKLTEMQVSNGGWPWFKGGPDDRYITQLIVCGIGRLRKLGITPDDEISRSIRRAVKYLDDRISDDYAYILRWYAGSLNEHHLSSIHIHYLYTRSYFTDIPVQGESSQKAVEYFKKQASTYWTKHSHYEKGMLSIYFKRYNDAAKASSIAASLNDEAIRSDELGMYWKGMMQGGMYWYQSPIEWMSVMVECFDEVRNDAAAVEEMKIWLLKNKQTNDWKTTRATADACYALLRRGAGLLSTGNSVTVQLGNTVIDPASDPELKTEAGTGYFRKIWTADQTNPSMGEIKVSKKTGGIAWGAMYWQYFESLDKITPAETGLQIRKQVTLETFTDRGRVLVPVNEATLLNPGDRIIIRMEIISDRPMEYVHIKDMRASALEPENVFSGYNWKSGLGYYESTRDAATHFFVSFLPKGTFVTEYPLRVTHKGNFSNGITTLECMYAPEFSAHSEGVRITVK